jgi:hypothetical protein
MHIGAGMIKRYKFIARLSQFYINFWLQSNFSKTQLLKSMNYSMELGKLFDIKK